jgi:hypothetical protein
MNKSKKIPFVLLKMASLIRKIRFSFKLKRDKKEVKNKVEPITEKKLDYSSSGLIVIENLVYQLDNQNSKIELKEDPAKSQTIPPVSNLIAKSDESVQSKDEKKKKEFDDLISVINYLALAGLFLVELVCNTVIWYIVTN